MKGCLCASPSKFYLFGLWHVSRRFPLISRLDVLTEAWLTLSESTSDRNIRFELKTIRSPATHVVNTRCLDYTDMCEQRWGCVFRPSYLPWVLREDRRCVQTPWLESNRGIDQLGLKGLIDQQSTSLYLDVLKIRCVKFHFHVWLEDRQTKTNWHW